MNSSFSSVTDIFIGLKVALQADVMASVVREISVSDCILERDGSFLRIRMEDFGSVRAIQLLLGDDEERVALDTRDPRYCMPFLVDGSVEPVNVSTHWSEASSIFNIHVSSDDMKRYRVDCVFPSKQVLVFHQFHLEPSKEGNFFQTGSDFVRCGA